MKAKLIKIEDGYKLLIQGFLKGSTNHELIDSLNVEEGNIRYKLSLKNCQAIEHGYDLDELAESYARKTCEDMYKQKGLTSAEWGWETASDFKKGFQKALELMDDKKYTEKDIDKAYWAGMQFVGEDKGSFSEFIQSLQQTEWDVEIEMEKVKDETKIIGSVKGIKGSGHKITTYKSVPKLNADGCLILKRI